MQAMSRWPMWILPVAVLLVVVTVVFSLGFLSAEETSPPDTPATGTATTTATNEQSAATGDAPASPGTPDDAASPAVTPEPQATLTPEELAEYQPNELGRIMVLMYHGIDMNEEDVWTRTPEQFRRDLQWLYDNNFYVIPARDYMNNTISAPPGKRPVVLTFDDGLVSQFRYTIDAAGNTIIDPDSAIGILEEFFTQYDDFGRGGLFSILPLAPFAWPGAEDQIPYAQEKLQWLLNMGYELGNHTVGHINMRESSDEVIKAELGGAVKNIQEYVPEAEIEIIAIPFGLYPAGGDTTLFEGFDSEGEHYRFAGALMVGAEPGPSPNHVDFDPYWTPRIRADDEELGKWFAYMEENPGMIYVSDGNPHTIAIPENIHPSLADAFDEEKASGKTIIRY